MKALNNQLTESLSDSELKSSIEQNWMNFESGDDLSIKKKDQLFPKSIVRKSLRTQYIQMAIVALIAVVAVGLLSVQLVSHNSMLSRYSSQNVNINAGQSGMITMDLPDGSTVTLNSRSTISYPSDFGIDTREVTLTGEAFFHVAKDANREFVVHTPASDITVYGTRFNVFAYKGKDIEEVSLVDGSVKVESMGSESTLVPGQKVTIVKSTGNMNVRNTDNIRETAWMKDDLVFMHEPLSLVFETLERKFGVIINCAPGINLADRYTGSFNERSLNDVLKILKMHYGFSYVSDGDSVMLYYER